ncbi:MAG: tetratricopeptide repeat protein [Chloroflexi bacterium]|nr:tetratricopeptide repeat protein [Chloroflexota bacterium]
MSSDAALADVLRQLMQAKGWGQERLAQDSGVSKKTIHNWLKSAGVRKPHTWQPLINVARTLGLSKAEANRLLLAARQPALDLLLAQTRDESDRSLLQPWLQITPHNLPHPVTSFVGRAAEIEAVCGLLEQTRLVLLTGAGGSGKTRLALAVAEQSLDRFVDGVWFVNLSPIDEAALVLPVIAQTLGLHEVAYTSLQDSLKHYLRARRLLLVLDNFEQVIDAAPAISALLAAAPSLTILVTSRTVLHLSGEHEFVVPPLPVPSLEQSGPEDLIAHTPAVALFVQRAQAVDPSFAITAENARAIAEICLRLDGLPLAIELAAARIKVLSPQALLARLVGTSGQQALDLLRQGARDLPTRHRTLHAAIDWSYALLEPEEQKLFARLAVFTNGWTLDLAETICRAVGDPSLDVLAGVAALVDHSLLVRAAGPDDQQRFAMLATIREYALAQLTQHGELEALRRSHAHAYVAFVEVAYPFLCGPQQHIWLRRLRAEHDNLRAALSWTINAGELEHALRLAIGLWEFWAVQGAITEGRRWMAQLLDRDGRRYPALWAEALHAGGKLAFYQGDYAQARSLLGDALAAHQALDNTAGIMDSFNSLGQLAREQGDYAQAQALHEQSLRLAEALNDDHILGHTLMYLGQNAIHAGDPEQAQRYVGDSIDSDDEPNDPMGMAVATSALGSIAYLRQDYPRAARLWQQCLGYCQIVEDRLRMTRALCRLGDATLRLGALDEARQHYLTSLRLCRDVADKLGMVENLAGLSALAAQQNDLPLAARFGATAAALCRRLGVELPAMSRQLLDETLTIVRQSFELPPHTFTIEPLALLEDLLSEVIDGQEPVKIEL